MERQIPLRVRFDDPNTFYGFHAKERARDRAKSHGAGLYIHGSGKATLYYREGEGLRQKTWARITIAEPLDRDMAHSTSPEPYREPKESAGSASSLLAGPPAAR